MKSAAVRQRELRQRRTEQGELRQLHLWVTIKTHGKLREISRAMSKPMGVALEDVLNHQEICNTNFRKLSRRKKERNSLQQLELNL